VSPETWKKFVSKRNAALLGCDFVTAFRDKYVWEEGKEFVMADFEGMSLYMAGVFTPKDPSYRNVILTGRVFLQEVEDRRGVANQVFIEIDNRQNAGKTMSAIEAMDFPVKIHVEPAKEAMDQAMDDLNDMLGYASWVILFTGLVILVCIANTISMSTYDRLQEIGILRSIGFERSRVFRIILTESTMLGLMGGAVGCLAAYLLLSLGNQQFCMRGITIPLRMRHELFAVGLGMSVVVGLAGGILPAFKASRATIVASLRKAE